MMQLHLGIQEKKEKRRLGAVGGGERGRAVAFLLMSSITPNDQEIRPTKIRTTY
jgi:hypothetical protein